MMLVATELPDVAYEVSSDVTSSYIGSNSSKIFSKRKIKTYFQRLFGAP